VVKRVTWYGENVSVDYSATIIERPLDATQYFNQTGCIRRDRLWS